MLGFLLRLLGLTQGNIVSVSLVTPAAVGGDEKEMLANQVAAYERANLKFGDQGMEVRLPQPDGSFKTEFVKPNIVAFNAGVNSFSLGKLSPFFGGWGPSDRLNNQSFKALVGDLASGGALGGMAGEKVAALRQQLSDPAQAGQHMAIRQKIGVIQDLAGQIKDMLADGSHHSAGNEPYKFPVRLLALANECDASPAFNCKSGKDRTGQLDVEIKDFYTSLNVNEGQVRDLNHRRSDAENLNLKTLFEQGGGREIQKYNTGIPGSKVDLKIFYNLFQFTSDKIDALKGLSKWVGSSRVDQNQSIFIPQAQKHQLINQGADWLHIIETQTGAYLEEDDITRYELPPEALGDASAF